MGSILARTGLTDACFQELLALLGCSTARHPSPSICLLLIKQHQSHWRPAAWQSSQSGPQGTDCSCRPLPHPPPIGVCSKDHRGVCSETLQLKFHDRSEPSQGPLDPTVGRQQDKSSSLESIFTKQGQLARIQPWKEQSLDFKHTEVQQAPLML